MHTVGRLWIAALCTIMLALVLAVLFYFGAVPRVFVNCLERGFTISETPGMKLSIANSGCESVKPILERLVGVFRLSSETYIIAEPVNVIAEVDDKMDRLLCVMRDEGPKAQEGQEPTEETHTRGGEIIFYKTKGKSFILSADRSASMWIYSNSMTFKQGHGSENVSETCYRNDNYKVYVQEHASTTYGNAYALITIFKDAQLVCSCRYQYAQIYIPVPPAALELRKARDAEYILLGILR